MINGIDIEPLLSGRAGHVVGSQNEITACLLMRRCIATVRALPGGICQRGSEDFRVVHTRFSRWARSGVWKRIFEALSQDADNEYASIDSTIVRAHQHSAGAKNSRPSGAAVAG